MQKPGSGNVSWLRLPLTVLCFHVFAEKKSEKLFCLFLLPLFRNLRTAPPRLSTKIPTVATIPNTVQYNSCNDLPPLLLVEQSLLAFLCQTCHGLISRFTCVPIRSYKICVVAPHSRAYTSNCKENVELSL